MTPGAGVTSSITGAGTAWKTSGAAPRVRSLEQVLDRRQQVPVPRIPSLSLVLHREKVQAPPWGPGTHGSSASEPTPEEPFVGEERRAGLGQTLPTGSPILPFATPVPAIEDVEAAPVIEYVALAPPVTISTPSQQFPPAYAMAAVITGVSHDTTDMVNPRRSTTAVEDSAPQVVGSLLPLDESAAPVYNQVSQQQIVVEETTQNMVGRIDELTNILGSRVEQLSPLAARMENIEKETENIVLLTKRMMEPERVPWKRHRLFIPQIEEVWAAGPCGQCTRWQHMGGGLASPDPFLGAARYKSCAAGSRLRLRAHTYIRCTLRSSFVTLCRLSFVCLAVILWKILSTSARLHIASGYASFVLGLRGLAEHLMEILPSFVQVMLGTFNVPAMYVAFQAVLSLLLRDARRASRGTLAAVCRTLSTMATRCLTPSSV